MAKWKLNIYDSAHPDLDLNLHGMTACTYEPIWQGIRVNLSFENFERVRKSIAVCQAYIDRAVEPLELTRRLVRVRNLLAAIPLYDHRQDGDSVDIIQVAQIEFKKVMSEREYYLEWDWNTARTQIPSMHANTRIHFNKMMRSLNNRASRPGPKYALRYFLKMIDEEIHENVT